MIHPRHDHNGNGHMFSERDGAVISLAVIVLVCFCSVCLRMEFWGDSLSISDVKLWQGESQRSRKHSEESCRLLSLVCESKHDAVITMLSLYTVTDGLLLLGHWHTRVIYMSMASVLCGLLTIYAGTCLHLLNAGRVAQGACVVHVSIDRGMWWLDGNTTEFLECVTPIVEEHRVISGCVPVVKDGLDWWTAFVVNVTLLGLDVQITVMDVVDCRRYLCLHQRCDGIFWDGTALLTSMQTAKERPPPEPPPAWWISPEPPPVYMTQPF